MKAALSKCHMLSDAYVMDGTLSVDLWYPPRRNEPPTDPNEPFRVEVGLSDVRAADSIRIHYDFDRDGYVVEQASRFTWATADDNDADWQEVAFIQAWARAETEEQQEARLIAAGQRRQ